MHKNRFTIEYYHDVSCNYCGNINKDKKMTKVHDLYVCSDCESKIVKAIEKADKQGFTELDTVYEDNLLYEENTFAIYNSECINCNSKHVVSIPLKEELDLPQVTYTSRIYCFNCISTYAHEWEEERIEG